MVHGCPIHPFIERHGMVILDGGLATELERRGHDLDHPLWSARLLDTHPDDIHVVHTAYLEAGADCIITASYQATVQGFMADGLTETAAHALLERSVDIACAARDAWAMTVAHRGTFMRPLVAASVGPYGAFLADGSEFRGDYGISDQDLRAFHAPRWFTLADTTADLLACETIPSLQEARVLLSLLHDTPGGRAWMSFTCRDGQHLCDGTPIARCAELLATEPQIVALGINCTAPRFVGQLIDTIGQVAPGQHIVVYPNSGETYDARTRSWTGIADPTDFAAAARAWRSAGATLIGGCCRTTPTHIAALRAELLQSH